MTQQCAVVGLPRRPMTVVLMPRMQTSRAYEFMGVNPPSFPSIPPHENAALDPIKVDLCASQSSALVRNDTI